MTKISRLGLNGQALGDILGPSNVSAITLVVSPEPSTALLLCGGLLAFATRRRASPSPVRYRSSITALLMIFALRSTLAASSRIRFAPSFQYEIR
ncbi:MAG: PEP-CTERM sorting domain-containing protein [Deltaproteobacteria bacterium]|nr:MAG: PEP-CTERM sorting domain-containing protein [Deltaproteobacteria bacterium]